MGIKTPPRTPHAKQIAVHVDRDHAIHLLQALTQALEPSLMQGKKKPGPKPKPGKKKGAPGFK